MSYQMRPSPELLREILDGTADLERKIGETLVKYDRIQITRAQDTFTVTMLMGETPVASFEPLVVQDTCSMSLIGLGGLIPITFA